MCFLTKCNGCQKITWQGCGRHVKQLQPQVPPEQQCKCKPWA